MRYQNIIFDFGNVIGRFDAHHILGQFCSSDEDSRILSEAIFPDWPALDRGTLDYDGNIENVVSRVPARLENTVRAFFREWPGCVNLLAQTEAFIHELEQTGAHLYLLSNAPTRFAEWFTGCDILKNFSGLVFSAPIKMAKPEPGIYRYLFDTFGIAPEDCFFIDDLEENIAAGQALGMDGILFTGDIEAVKRAIEF